MTDLPDVKLKALVNFPAQVTGRTGITVTKSSPNYYLDLDYTTFQITPTVSIGDMPNSYNLIWDEAKHTFAKVPFALQATSGVSSLGAQTGAIILDDGLSMVGSTLTPTERIPVYDTATALAASAAVVAAQTVLRTRGKLAVGDFGGATYLQVASDPSEPGSFALASGRWAKLLEVLPTPQMFKLSTDVGNDALMFGRFFTYVNTIGGEGIVPKAAYAFSTQVTITAPSTYRSKVKAYGATFTTTGAINPFYITGGAYSGGMDLEGFTVLHQGNATAISAFQIRNAGNIRLISPAVSCGLTNANYFAIYIGQSNAADAGTGSNWCTIQDCEIYSTTVDKIPICILIEGQANATRIIGGEFSTFTHGVYIHASTGSVVYASNGLVIDGLNFEVGTNAIHFHGVAGDASSRPFGLKVINTRVESVTSFLDYLNVDQNSDSPTILRNNMLLAVTNYINNASAVRVVAEDYPASLAGTAALAAATTVAVTFGTAQPSTNYIVNLETFDSKTYWVTSKTVNGFTINASSATTGTVGWKVTRL